MGVLSVRYNGIDDKILVFMKTVIKKASCVGGIEFKMCSWIDFFLVCRELLVVLTCCKRMV